MTEEVKDTNLEENVEKIEDMLESADDEALSGEVVEEATGDDSDDAMATSDDADEDITSESDEAQEEPSIESLQSELETLREESAKNLEGWQRAAAEMANYKRRQEEQASRRTADIKANIIKDILPALDDLDLAFQNLPDSLNEQESGWVEGFALVQRKLIKTLENNNIQMISADGDFDPNLHEAVTYEESPDHESNTIIAELRKGYMTGDRVIRPALVRVAQ